MPPHHPAGGTDQSPMDANCLPAQPPIFPGYVLPANRDEDDEDAGDDEAHESVGADEDRGVSTAHRHLPVIPMCGLPW